MTNIQPRWRLNHDSGEPGRSVAGGRDPAGGSSREDGGDGCQEGVRSYSHRRSQTPGRGGCDNFRVADSLWDGNGPDADVSGCDRWVVCVGSVDWKGGEFV